MEDLKTQFQKLVFIHHPDGKGGSTEKFLEIKDCYDKLITHKSNLPPMESQIFLVTKEDQETMKKYQEVREQIEKEKQQRLKEEDEKHQRLMALEQQRRQEQEKRDEVRRHAQLKQQMEQQQKSYEYMRKLKAEEAKQEEIRLRNIGDQPHYNKAQAMKDFDAKMDHAYQEYIRNNQGKLNAQSQHQMDPKKAKEQDERVKENAKKQENFRIDSVSADLKHVFQPASDSDLTFNGSNGNKRTIITNQTAQNSGDQGSIVGIIGLFVVGAIAYAINLANQPSKSDMGQWGGSRGMPTQKFSEMERQLQKQRQKEEWKKRVIELNKELFNPEDWTKDKVGQTLKQETQDCYTVLRIPYEMAKPDPDWYLKKWAGEKIIGRDLDSWFEYKCDQEYEMFKKQAKAPGSGIFLDIYLGYFRMKKDCNINDSCSGWNEEIFDGQMGGCGHIDPFVLWKQRIVDKDYDKMIDFVIDNFQIPPFGTYYENGGHHLCFNKFWMSRYGLFTCYDTHKKFGEFKPHFGLIEQYEKKNLDRMYAFSILSTLCNGDNKWDSVPRKQWYQTKSYLSMMARNKDSHESSMRLEQAIEKKQQLMKAKVNKLRENYKDLQKKLSQQEKEAQKQKELDLAMERELKERNKIKKKKESIDKLDF